MATRKHKQRVVLLADRHQDMLAGIRSMLETRFDAVVMVADERSLLEAAGKLKPSLAVVDLSLPVSGEVNVASRLHKKHPELKFIILSVHDEAVAVNAVINAGAAGFVLKRAAVTELVRAVDSVLAGDNYVSPAIEQGQ